MNKKIWLALPIPVAALGYYLATPSEKKISTVEVPKQEISQVEEQIPKAVEAVVREEVTATKVDLKKAKQEKLEEVYALVNKGKSQEAAQALGNLLQASPEDPDLNAEMGLLYARKLNDPGQALSYFEKALQKNSEHGGVLEEIVHMASTSKDKEIQQRGKEVLQQLVRNKPAAVGPNAALSDLQNAQGNPEGSLRTLEAAVQASNEPPNELSYRLVEQYYRTHQPAKVEEYFQSRLNQAQAKFAQSPTADNQKLVDNAQIDVGFSKMQNGKYRDADDVLQRLKEKDGSDPQIDELYKTNLERMKANSPPQTQVLNAPPVNPDAKD